MKHVLPWRMQLNCNSHNLTETYAFCEITVTCWWKCFLFAPVIPLFERFHNTSASVVCLWGLAHASRSPLDLRKARLIEFLVIYFCHNFKKERKGWLRASVFLMLGGIGFSLERLSFETPLKTQLIGNGQWKTILGKWLMVQKSVEKDLAAITELVNSQVFFK